jgi:uncharacterized membrane protein YciS (DUF1049 family)
MTDLAVGFYTTLTVFLVFGLVVLGIMYFELRGQLADVAHKLADVLEQINDGGGK